jgi:hypothetical protein
MDWKKKTNTKHFLRAGSPHMTGSGGILSAQRSRRSMKKERRGIEFDRRRLDDPATPATFQPVFVTSYRI